jgi:hypothetical protein
MKSMGIWIVGLTLGVGLITAFAEMESYKFIKITDFNGEPEYKVVSSTELKELNEVIRIEARCIDKALSQAKDEWQKREKKSMPLGTPKPRKVDMVFSSANQDTAQKELDKFLEKKEKQEDSRNFREAEKAKNNKQHLTDKKKEEMERRADRKVNEESALELFKVKLESAVAAEKEKMAAKAAGTPAAAGAPAAAGGEKPAAGGL